MAGKEGRTLKLQIIGDIGDIKKDVASVNKTIGGLSKTAKAAGGVIVGAFAVDTVVDFAKGAIGAASDLQESMSKVGVVFGDSARDIERWSQSSSTAMGLSQQKALEAAGTFGNLFDAIGLTEQATLEMSKGAVQLASDLASFNNADTEEVLLAIRSGLLGEAEPMRKFGASLSEARVQAYGMANGLGQMVRSGKTFKFVMSDSEKMTARYRLILEDTKNAQGDFVRTSDGLANSQRTAEAEMANLNARIGQMLMPLGDGLVKAALAAVDAIDNLGDAFHDLERFMSPHLAAVEDVSDALRQMGEQHGFDAEQVVEWVEQQRAAKKAAEEHAAAVEMDANEMARRHQLAADQAMLWRANNRVEKDAVLTAEQAAESSRFVTEMMRQQGYVVDATGTKWVTASEKAQLSMDAMTQAAREHSRFMQSQQSQFRLAPLAAPKGIEDIGDTIVSGAIEAASGVRKVLAPLPRFTRAVGHDSGISFGEGIRDTRDEVRQAAKDLKWALTHPFDAEKELMHIRGGLLGERLASGIKRSRNDPRVRGAVMDYIAAQRERLDRLKEAGYDVGYETSLAISAGIEANPYVQAFRRAAKKEKSSGIKGLSLYDLIETSQATGGRTPKRKKRKPRAAGGPTMPGEEYLVGEDGPEVLRMGSARGHVTPNDRIGGTTLNIVVNGYVGSEAQLARELNRILSSGVQRGMRLGYR